MRAMNRNPTQNEIHQMIKEVDKDGSGTVSLDEFSEMMKTRKQDPKREQEALLASFKSVFLCFLSIFINLVVRRQESKLVKC